MTHLKFLNSEELKASRICFELGLPRLFYWFLYGIIAMLCAATVYAWLGSIDEVVRAPALLRTTYHSSEIKTEISGKIIEKNYSHSQQVEAGDLLFVLEYSSLEANLGTAEQELLRLQRMRQDARYVHGVLTGNSAAAGSHEAKRRAELIHLESERLKLHMEKANREFEREQGLPTAARVQTRLQDLEMTSQLAESQYRMYTLQEIQKLSDELDSLAGRIEDVRRQIVQYRKHRLAAEVRAPISGWIDEVLRLNEGDLVAAGQPVLRIIPEQADQVSLEIIVPTNDIPRLKEGQTIRMQFPGLSSAEYGYALGRVTSVPRDAKIMNETPVFIVGGELDQNWLENNHGERVWLSAGMQADSRIIVRTRPIWRYVLEKLGFIL
jgi:multidrug efflux pump subunit AcrA (membrane-fusion protein)